MPVGKLNGIDLYWTVDGGAGAPLVLVHGSWGDHQGWARIVPELSRRFRVVTYDRRGHSRSARCPEAGRVADDVADLAAIVEHVAGEPAHIVGNSFGGVIVLRLAAVRPDLFRTLIVHEPPAFGLLDESTAGEMLRSARDRIRAVVDLLERGQMDAGARLFMETVAFGPGAWTQFPTELRQTFVFNAPTFLDEERDAESRTIGISALAEFGRPALLTQGEISEPFFPMIVDLLARAMPTAQRRTLPGAGHVPHVTHPEEYVDTIAGFVRSVG